MIGGKDSSVTSDAKRTIEFTNLKLKDFTKSSGKVKDIYTAIGDPSRSSSSIRNGKSSVIIIVTTDRVSAFDRNLGLIPYKGQVLTQITQWWFEKLNHILGTHFLECIDPNVLICKQCKVFPIEFVVRGYITGTTNTSLWFNYNQGVREYCGHTLPDGLRKNQKLEKNICTPTTKESHHDTLITPESIVAEGYMKKEEYDYCEKKALEIFSAGQAIAEERGLILVDTKYEFGRDLDGNIVLVDEVHTPDSSRYWLSDSYHERFSSSCEPESFDKEILRIWYKSNFDPYNDKSLPPLDTNLAMKISNKYIELYEKLIQEKFDPGQAEISSSIEARIDENIRKWFDFIGQKIE